MLDDEGFQVIEHDSLKSLKHDLRGECKLGFVRARPTNEFDMYAKMKAKYPTWTKIMSSIAGSMEVNSAFAEFLFAIIEH